ncbi:MULTISPECIES: deoxyguanosinetriphosphate triphosphohydrolase [unclassified Sphingomonas]|uniref:deoxyguanosinetriphosphate triphosphohydrolase n=1 Tax=unclassified Sphingomonas TaxID=196159 RepID=UPI0006F6D263|nr:MULTISPECIES: deoxyguanosinetriphosphate triphosphohydrolase [unclassified Sphingomonas]KQX17823.1 deoxyguanosinetriphosphate triphosphohydrolase [Sphingomonas sp. Root1294]KQY70749.1 deoxyguanosinetriphosphate triphosphohydrolase [Sphingomonas sp. Root50]KRB91758.1 deoxyguanosinetriphosphate triphosphohydrolase [Sphingomonas sp. Root720]
MPTLAPYASDPSRSRGRFHILGGGETRGPRDAFQRDRDRIIHSISFRRLRHKTQVFVAPDGDHYRVRLTHSLEVAQIGRTVARALGLNEDLTEALCLGHDIGHPPFGHAGEEALQTAMAGAGGFDHNAHTLRILTRLDSPYPAHDGLNLSWETLEGLAKHNGPVRKRTWAMAEVDGEWPLDLDSWAGAEAQVAALADDIAYDNHDIDDGVRAGLLTLEQVLEDSLIRSNWDRVRARYPDVAPARLIGELVREQIGCMVNDLLDESRRRLDEAAPRSVEDVRAAGRPLIGFSEPMAAREKALTRFMYANLYHHPQQLDIAVRMGSVIAGLAAAYKADPRLMPDKWRETLPADEPGLTRHIGDFIAGMTDRYALSRYRDLVGPISTEGF